MFNAAESRASHVRAATTGPSAIVESLRQQLHAYPNERSPAHGSIAGRAAPIEVGPDRPASTYVERVSPQLFLLQNRD
jgi:hypothetical protein